MANYEYSLGNWKQISDPASTTGRDGDDLEKIFMEMGFLPEVSIGPKGKHFSIEVYSHRDGRREEGYEYIVLPNTNTCSWDAIYIPDLPSYLMFMREMAPLVHMNSAIGEEE